MIIFKLVWNIFSVILLCILKLTSRIFQFIFIVLANAISFVGSHIYAICYTILGGIILVSILGSMFFNMTLTSNEIKVLVILAVLFIGIPYCVALYGAIFLTFLSELCEDILWGVPITAWSIPLSSKKKNNNANQKSNHTDSYCKDSYTDEFHSEHSSSDQSLSRSSSNLYAGIKNTEALRKRYLDLQKIYHPDNNNGDTSMSQYIQLEYDRLLKNFNTP